jgi:hypothetical protein
VDDRHRTVSRLHPAIAARADLAPLEFRARRNLTARSGTEREARDWLALALFDKGLARPFKVSSL